MRKPKRFKIKYIYNKPKTSQEKEEQQRKIDSAFDIIFKKLLDRS